MGYVSCRPRAISFPESGNEIGRDVQCFTANNRLILTVFAGKYVSLLGESNKLRHRSSLKALPRVSLSRELTR